MGIENRDYYQTTPRGDSFWDGGRGSVVWRLIIANIVVFVLQIVIVRTPTEVDQAERRDLYGAREAFIENYVAQKDLEQRQAKRRWNKRARTEQSRGDEAAASQEPAPVILTQEELTEEAEETYDLMMDRADFLGIQQVSVIQEWCELDTQKVMKGQIWRLVTCAFCHDRYGILHILFNMLFLYWFGEILERMYGPREFLLFYFAAAIAASLAYIGLDLVTGNRAPSIGASGAVMGVFMLFVCHFPHHQIRIYFLFPIEVRWILLLYIAYDLHPVLLALSGSRMSTGIGHAAHLGGLAFGYLYFKQNLHLERLWESIRRFKMPDRSATRPQLRLHQESAQAAIPLPVKDGCELDEILRKIHEQGRESLTEAEVAKLNQASERLRKR